MGAENLIEKLRERGHIILFFVFVLGTYFKSSFFFYGIWSDMGIGPFLPKLVAAIALGAPIFLFRRFSIAYALVISLIIDIWIVANFIYFRCNGVLINSLAMSMVGNMEGFWNSVFLFLNLKMDLIPFLVTLLTILPMITIIDDKFMPKTFICLVLFLYPLSLYSHYSDVVRGRGYWDFSYTYDPYNLCKVFSLTEYNEGTDAPHVMFSVDPRNNSVIHLFVDDLRFLRYVKKASEKVDMPEKDEQRLNSIGISKGLKSPSKYDNKLVLILVESMECWALSPESMPNLWKFIQTHNHLRAEHIISQVRQGTSADGQMILNTGLLPLKQGAACYLFPNNTFPSLPKLTDNKSLCILPHNLSVWNQAGMSHAYAYDDNICLDLDDKVLFSKLNQLIEEDEYKMIQLITLSTHANFELVSGLSDLKLPDDMPTYSQNFLKSFNYFDKYLGTFLAKIDSSEVFKNVTFVITGDHIIFPDDKRNDMKRYSQNHNNEYDPKPYVNAIIYSPKLDRTIVVPEETYQMDIYPTLLGLLDAGYSNYKGVGVNLLDSVKRNNRILNQDEAWTLSDIMIRSDFFEE